MTPRTFLMAGGGTGGHVIPLLAVARELRRRGHQPLFVGTRQGIEARLAPAEGFEIEWIEAGGLNRVTLGRMLRSLWQLPAGVARCWRLAGRRRVAAVFSLGGYAAGPPMVAAWLRRIPIVLMEPNAMPGLTARRMGRRVARALVSFPEAARFFPPDKTELTGLPVREEFFRVPVKPRGAALTVLIAGGSQGSRRLNEAARAAWPRLAAAPFPVRLVHQTGRQAFEDLARDFAASGLEGRVAAFIDDMAGAFAEADLVVCRSGAGAVAELAAAGRASLLVPFPFAADDHQTANARSLEAAGAARLVADGELDGQRLAREILDLASRPGLHERRAAAARGLARPGAAVRAADLVEELAGGGARS
ncbi:MAG: undecaprenyldiphospho-muramoylpentapeptide beta-N-acetylglucosaminyltransferase [Acidobacteria bacterium]|nr:undecaprenyldiphospho-muramoylpentapeptide beta-N-acetylglucosaminyltransferase [Acidobacteriota bacterium]